MNNKPQNNSQNTHKPIKQMYCVYFLIDNNNPYYVGLTKNPNIRYKSNMKKQSQLVVIEAHKLLDDAVMSEKYWIEQLRQWGFSLKNGTDNILYKYCKKTKSTSKTEVNKLLFKIGDCVYDNNWDKIEIKRRKNWSYCVYKRKQIGVSSLRNLTGYCQEVPKINNNSVQIVINVPKEHYKHIMGKLIGIVNEYEIAI